MGVSYARIVIHYHGTPISPMARMELLKGKNFCVSFWRPDDIRRAHVWGQNVMLDNGAFSAWRKHVELDWDAYYIFAERWLTYRTTWAVIPDVIDGSEDENDDLVERWPFGERGAPVWHLHESLERLERLVRSWPRVCLGSSGQYARVGSEEWHARMFAAMRVCVDDRGRPLTWLHMLRGMSLSAGPYPFSSVDSTDVARNHNRPQNGDIYAMAKRWDGMNPPATWNHIEAAAQLKLNPFLVG